MLPGRNVDNRRGQGPLARSPALTSITRHQGREEQDQKSEADDFEREHIQSPEAELLPLFIGRADARNGSTEAFLPVVRDD
jgi:hypothetical protein